MDESKLHPSDTWNFTAGEPHIPAALCTAPISRTPNSHRAGLRQHWTCCLTMRTMQHQWPITGAFLLCADAAVQHRLELSNLTMQLG
jgi:hypothetical protein